ncbi:MAG: hypothetical protein MOB07_11110 [Acidobacteria bacterium]|nr:hypothetical protein [Acidobacteriota bacterium]
MNGTTTAPSKEHRRAIDLNPNSADVRRGYAIFLAYMGRFEQAISEIRRAKELDPTSPLISRNIAFILYLARHTDEALEQSRLATELNPTAVLVNYWIFKAYEMKGNEQEAFAAYLKRMEASRARSEEIAGMKTAFVVSGWKGCLRRILDRLLEQEKSGFALHANLALLHTLLGEKEQALARLQKVVEDHYFEAVIINVDPAWDAYRTDPRFMALVRRVGLAP